jgi:ATP-binding cassette, subfamily B, bacterial
MPTTLPKFLWHFSKRYKLNLIGLIFVACFWATYISLSPYTMKLIIDRVAETGLNTEALFEKVKIPAIVYVLLGFLLGAVFRFYDWMLIKILPIKSDITSEMFAYVEGHSYNYFQQNFAGSLANKINDMAKGSATIISNLIDHFLARALSFIVGAFTMYFVNPNFSMVLIIWIVIFISVSLFLSKKSQRYSEIFSEARSQVVGKVVDSIGNILSVKLFAREGYEKRYLQKFLTDSVSKDRNLHWYLLKVKVFYGISITVLVGSMTWLLIYERSLNRVTVGDFALILTLTMILIEEAFFIATQLVEFSELIGTCKQGLSIISVKHEIVDLPHAVPLHATRGQIVFDKVHFQYKNGESIFADKSITIRSGEKVGLVGFSGSGKSTFVNLILRFFEVDSGKILIDDQDIKKVTQHSLRSQIAMIPQDPSLFHRTLMENIRYGRLEATDDEVIEVARKAHCQEFIEKLQDGYDSLVGERGVKLSGGQRQRIAIARALLKNAPILILDEATSSLDSVTEHYIQESLAELMKGRTTIVIAHRLSTLFHMDRILVFSEGKIIEDGTHSELINLNGHYTKLWSMQAGGFIVDNNH